MENVLILFIFTILHKSQSLLNILCTFTFEFNRDKIQSSKFEIRFNRDCLTGSDQGRLLALLIFLLLIINLKKN